MLICQRFWGYKIVIDYMTFSDQIVDDIYSCKKKPTLSVVYSNAKVCFTLHTSPLFRCIYLESMQLADIIPLNYKNFESPSSLHS